VRAPDDCHVVFELVQVSVRTVDRSGRRIEGLKQTIAKSNSGMRVIDRREKRRTSYVAQRSVRREVRTECSRILDRGISLMIEELDGESRIDCGLVRIVRWSSDLIEAEPRE